MGKGGGDRLAQGAASASWGPLDVSQAKWDSMWEPEILPVKPKRKPRTKRRSKLGK
jgi:hypothetical protein